MPIKIYNTLTKKKDTFEPLVEGQVGIYACGITAYDVCHVGHARSAVVFDVITRYFQYRGYHVTYVKNFTDVDDKIIVKANAEGKTISEISERYIREHDEDMDALGIARPTVAPRATEHIAGMIKLINILIANGLAYEADGDIYYAVEKFKGYGKLSGRNLEEMIAGARVDVSEKKRYPLDFALWKASKEGEPWWDSPWGRGRPGWHIECSIMSQNFLGETFDIHGGGEDLIFPHHENEIAQSESYNGAPFVRYWLHNGLLQFGSEKMSKSLGNLITVREALERYGADALRLFVLSSHYRSPLTYSEEALEAAQKGVERLRQALQPGNTDAKGETLDAEPYRKRFVEAMDDDFGTPQAVAALFDLARSINTWKEQGKDVSQAQDTLHELAGLLGLTLKEEQELSLEAQPLVELLIKIRAELRTAKQWQLADRIRAGLVELGITLEDTSQGTTWKYKK
jgi:cysteinyl-tRNA synthetase